MKIVVRFGIYQIEDRTIDVTVMYDRAALAVKRIKGKYGEAYAYFDDSMRNELLLEKEITNSMQQALADGEFLVYLQPKCNLKTEEYVGAEELKTMIEEKKTADFKLTYEMADDLYIVRGYGEQATGGYSICVRDCYLTTNAVVFDTELIGPRKGEVTNASPSCPYIVIQVKNQDKSIIFE